MKKLANVLTVMFSLFVCVFFVLNWNINIQIILFDKSLITVPIVTLLASFIFITLILSSMYNYTNYKLFQKNKIIQENRNEKILIGKDSADLKIKNLESKIKTLEVALEKALSNKDNN